MQETAAATDTVTSVASRCPAHHFIQKSHHRQKIIWTPDVFTLFSIPSQKHGIRG